MTEIISISELGSDWKWWAHLYGEIMPFNGVPHYKRQSERFGKGEIGTYTGFRFIQSA